jgi:nitrite reductase/ring-hydroxylating ferredoxin subunit
VYAQALLSLLAHYSRFVTIHPMQSFDTDEDNIERPVAPHQTIIAGRIEDLPSGSCRSVDLREGRELALYNVNGEFYATENFCPHKGAPLAEGILCGHVIECDWHGWQFDVRSGECLTVTEKLRTYEVIIEEGLIKVLV